MKIKYTKKCTTVYDCYKYTNKEIDRLGLLIVDERFRMNLPVTRSSKSYSSEIKVHKRAYLLGYKRDHSKDCDCEENISKKLELKYRILGL